jgi:hypothetical protein
VLPEHIKLGAVRDRVTDVPVPKGFDYDLGETLVPVALARVRLAFLLGEVANLATLGLYLPRINDGEGVMRPLRALTVPERRAIICMSFVRMAMAHVADMIEQEPADAQQIRNYANKMLEPYMVGLKRERW